ncbi:hypothetical protein [Mycobacterium sp. AZCC_0083]|uniref:hypothetical protein n=1 Tax=Mycobacterium sp. AZCC_0083 TaxID=2735882 RepID=UPI00161FBDDE|nr:hypothetical protein [Mycobacterium sp. AZCC_0083]MBB5167220.1 hypothetical protein [Mycobacterium sp. AZCC_0083]
MSAQISVLVEYIDGKPTLKMGYGREWNWKIRLFTRTKDAHNYREDVLNPKLPRYVGPTNGRDIRVLTVVIPDDGPVGEGIWPNLVPTPAVSWS